MPWKDTHTHDNDSHIGKRNYNTTAVSRSSNYHLFNILPIIPLAAEGRISNISEGCERETEYILKR